MSPILLALYALAFLLGENRVFVTGVQPNPGGVAQVIVAQGRYWVAPSNQLKEMKFVAESSRTGQLNWLEPGRTGSQWHGKLQIPAGEYDCWMELVTVDALGKMAVSQSQSVQLTVK